jgi:hypothetical protein
MTSLSNISDVTTERTNTPNTLTPIMEIEPDDGTAIVISNMVERGEEMGVPIFANLKDSNDDDLPAGTRMAITFEGPNDESPSVVSEPFDNIRPYRGLEVKEQQNEEFIDRVKHVLGGQALVIEDVDKAYVSIESDKQIDWQYSRVQFSQKAVQEV